MELPTRGHWGSFGSPTYMTEASRINFLIENHGMAYAVEWVRRTRSIYRKAVLNKNHFASKHDYREKFIRSYLEFKRFLRQSA